MHNLDLIKQILYKMISPYGQIQIIDVHSVIKLFKIISIDFTVNIQITEMRPQLEAKIRKHRQNKHIKNSFEQSVEGSRHKIKQYSKQFNSNTNTNNIDQFLQFNQNRYIEYTKELMESKNKQTELTHRLEDLKTEVYFQQKKNDDIKQLIESQRIQQEQMVKDKLAKYQVEKQDKVKMYEERIQNNINRIEQLLAEKQQQNARKMQFIAKKKKFQETKIKIKEAHEQEIQNSKEKFLQQETARRKNWEKQQSEKIQAGTLKTLQPEIKRIVQVSKDQITRIKESYDAEMTEFTKITDETYEETLSSFNKEQSLKLQNERQQILRQYAEKNRIQIEKKQQQFQDERVRVRNEYEKQIRDLQQERNRQSQQFLRKGKYFYLENLNQIRSIREEYEKEVRELDGKVQREVQERQREIAPKYREKIEQLRQQNKNKLRTNIQNFDRQQQKHIASNLQQFCNEIAIQNAAYQRKISRQTEAKIKQEKQNAEIEVKHLKKTIVALEKKIATLTDNRNNQKNERQEYETEYLEAKSDHESKTHKIYQLNNQLDELKVDESSVQLRKQQRKEEIARMWSNQIESIKQGLKSAQQQIKMLQSVMADQQSKLQQQTDEIIKEIQINAEKICQKKREQAARLRIKISEMQKLQDHLEGLIKRQQQYIEKYGIQ